MRFALIIAGGAGARLWPMSRTEQPKPLIPFLDGKCLLQIAFDRVEGLIPAANRYVCAAEKHKDIILSSVSGLGRQQFLGEPQGRDTLQAVGLGAAVLAALAPDAVIAVFTADHLIEPVAQFRKIIEQGFALVERASNMIVTFGITPTGPATGYGYLELGPPLDDKTLNGATPAGGAWHVTRFVEKPAADIAQQYFAAGPQRYLWNSGMAVVRASTVLDCISRYRPAAWEGLKRIVEAWHTPNRDEVLAEVYPTLEKISVDRAIMEPAADDPAVTVAAVPMPLQWRDVGSWPSFAETCPHDPEGNALAAEKHLLVDTSRSLVASDDPDHLIAMVGCPDLIVVHTANATLICRCDQAEQVKELYKQVEERFGGEYA